MSGDTGLLDIHSVNDIVHGLLAVPQYLYDLESRVVSEELQERNIHLSIYTQLCMYGQ